MKDWKSRPAWTKVFLLFLIMIISQQSWESRGFQENEASGADLPMNIVFERMWPVLRQPWYFSKPGGVAADSEGYIYVADTYNHCIQKLTAGGQLVSKWGEKGSNSGEFLYPRDIVVDKNNLVYVTDSGNHRVQKFNANGQFLTNWGKAGSGDGDFQSPAGIEADQNGSIYVVDSRNFRVQQFDASGNFIKKWGKEGTGAGEFGKNRQGYGPEGIAVDDQGAIYVADTMNDRVQKFTGSGDFLIQWGGSGVGAGSFSSPIGLIVSGNAVYVLDSGNGRIQVFDPAGTYLGQYGQEGGGPGEFLFPYDLAFDKAGTCYIADAENNRIQKLAVTSGQEGFVFLDQWQSGGGDNGLFQWPAGVVTDKEGNVYVCDTYNHRIQKFDGQGRFLLKWGTKGSGAGEFLQPFALAIDSHGALYVAESGNHRIQKFDSQGVFLAQWGGLGGTDGLFRSPSGVAVDRYDNVYVADSLNNRIQKFSSAGTFISKWGSKGSGQGQFNSPYGVAIGADDVVYVADTYNHRIATFTRDGQYLKAWGEEGPGSGQLARPYKVAIGSDGAVYVADTGNNRIQIFSQAGDVLGEFGEFGLAPGQLNTPYDVAVSQDGHIYVANTDNNRIEVFSVSGQPQSVSKAIIVAGGGPYSGNNLWDATQRAANNAYWTLYYKGFTKENIWYLSANTGLDLDQNGKADDVDGDATIGHFRDAVTWAADATSLFVYVVDHGGSGVFRMNGAEVLAAVTLDSWLDALQESTSCEVTVVYDACESGSFVAALTPPAGKKRIVIASTSPEESAYFVTQGAISFSSFFWTNIFNGLDIYSAFAMARSALGYATVSQNPLLDDNGNGLGNDAADGLVARLATVGNGVTLDRAPPEFVAGNFGWEQVNDDPVVFNLYATVTGPEAIARVWALIRPQTFREPMEGETIQDFPSIDLLPVGGNRYVASAERLLAAGIYQLARQSPIALYSQNSQGNTSGVLLEMPLQVGSAARPKAIIVAGGESADPLWAAVKYNSDLAYKALSFQGYSAEDIIFFRADASPGGQDVDNKPSVANLAGALSSCSQENCQDLVLYLVGSGCDEALRMSGEESLSPGALHQLLDDFQRSFSGKLIVILDASLAGSFLSPAGLNFQGKMIVIAGAMSDQPASFAAGGQLSFSSLFWKGILDGVDVRRAYLQGKSVLATIYGEGIQTPLLDDNGNGVGNEQEDGRNAATAILGAGIKRAGDDPLAGSILTATATNAAKELHAVYIRVDGITTTGTIAKVRAAISPLLRDVAQESCPETAALPTVELLDMGNGSYGGVWSNIAKAGVYRLTVLALDAKGNTSSPLTTSVLVGAVPKDTFDETALANSVPLTIDAVPIHFTIGQAGAQNWAQFYAQAGSIYSIKASNIGSRSDVVVELYAVGLNGMLRLAGGESYEGTGRNLELSWACPQGGDGVYSVLTRHKSAAIFGPETEYDLSIEQPIGPNLGFCYLIGYVKDEQGSGIAQPEIRLEGAAYADPGSKRMYLPESNDEGFYWHPSIYPGAYMVTVSKPGYKPQVMNDVQVLGFMMLDFTLLPHIIPPPQPQSLAVGDDGAAAGTLIAGGADAGVVTLVKTAQHGTLTLSAQGSFSYRHDGSSNLEDSFTYCITQNGVQSETAQVHFSVKSYIIRGRVIDREGNALPQVTVAALSSSSADRQFQGTTDGDGYYAIPVVPSLDYRVMAGPTGPYQLRLYDTATCWRDAALVDATNGNVSDIDLVLVAGYTISGQVTDLAPGVKATIEAWSPSTQSWGAVVLTGCGAPLPYTIEGLAEAGDYEISVWASGYVSGFLKKNHDAPGAVIVPWAQASRYEAGDAGVSFQFASGRFISGHITGLLAGEKATLSAVSAKTGCSAVTVITSAGQTDAYTLSGLSGQAADYRIALWTDKRGGGFYHDMPLAGTNLVPYELATVVDVTMRDLEGIDFTLPADSYSLSGRVTGLALRDVAVIDARSKATYSWGETRVVGSGAGSDPYTINGLGKAEDYLVKIAAEGYQGGFYAASGIVPEDGAEKVSIPRNDEDTVAFHLETGTTIAGIITGLAKGETAYLDAWSDTARCWGGTMVLGTGEAMPYTITSLTPAKDYTVHFAPCGYNEQFTADIDISSHPASLDFAVKTGRTLQGKVVHGPANGVVAISARGPAGAGATIAVSLDQEGSAAYALKGLPAEPGYVVGAVSDNLVFYYNQHFGLSAAEPVNLTAGDATAIDFDFQTSAIPLYKVEGEIVGLPAGMPTPVVISFWNADGYGSSFIHHGNGSFSQELPAGEYWVSLHRDGGRDAYLAAQGKCEPARPEKAPVSMTAFTTQPYFLGTFDLSSFAGRTVSGYVYLDGNTNGVMDQGEGTDNVFVEALTAGGGVPLGAFTNSRGHYEIEGLARGDYDLRTWSAAGIASQTRHVVVEDMDVQRVDIALVRSSAASIQGTLKRGGKTVGQAMVFLFETAADEGDASFVNAVFTDASGGFSFDGSAGHDYLLKIDVEGDGVFEAFQDGETRLPLSTPTSPVTLEVR